MSTLASVLLGIGVADLAQGLTGEPKSRNSVVVSVAAAIVVSGSAAALTDQEVRAFFAIVTVTAVIVYGWHQLRLAATHAAFPLAWLAAGLVAAIGLDSRARHPGAGSWRWMWDDLRVPALESISDERAMVIIALSILMVATGNSVVRLVLALDQVRADGDGADQVKGGRVIGPIERLIIFGALISGAATIAGFVIAAKSLLRFPELNQKSRIHETTEYVLIGSLTSWGLALLAALMGAGPG